MIKIFNQFPSQAAVGLGPTYVTNLPQFETTAAAEITDDIVWLVSVG